MSKNVKNGFEKLGLNDFSIDCLIENGKTLNDINENMTIRFYEIEYDTDGEELDSLPYELYFTLGELNWEKGDRVDDIVEGLGADKISDETGFCVLGFNWDLEY
jgi:hypothetical protein